jgi:hypothetical protein
MCFSNHERRSLVAVEVNISRAPAHGECSVRDRHKRTVGFIESAMPADGIPRCHSPRTETSARPVSKSSSKEDYTILRPSKRPHIGRNAAQTIRPKPVTQYRIASKAAFILCSSKLRGALERDASVHRRGTQQADAEHFDWRTAFVENTTRPDTMPRCRDPSRRWQPERVKCGSPGLPGATSG